MWRRPWQPQTVMNDPDNPRSGYPVSRETHILCVRAFRVELELEFRSAGFWGKGKTWVTGGKPLGGEKEPTTNLAHIWSILRIEPRWVPTSVGSKCSHHCASTTPQLTLPVALKLICSWTSSVWYQSFLGNTVKWSNNTLGVGGLINLPQISCFEILSGWTHP